MTAHSTSPTGVPVTSHPVSQPVTGSGDSNGLLGLSTQQRGELFEYYAAFMQRRFQVLGFAAIAALLAWVVCLFQTPYFKSTVTLIVDAPRLKTVRIDDVYDTVINQQTFYTTQTEIMRSPEVIGRAVDRLKLVEHPDFDPRRPVDSAGARALAALGLRPSAMPADTPPEKLRLSVMQTVKQSMTVDAVRGSSLVRIAFENPKPDVAALVANGLAEAYIENDLDSRFTMTQRATDWMNGRMVELKVKLTDSERALQNFRDSRGLVNAGGGAVSLVASQLSDLTARLIESRARRTEAQIVMDQIAQARTSGQPLDSVPQIMRSADVARTKDAVLIAERKFSEVSERYGREHPKFLTADAELRSARDTHRRQIDLAVAAVQKDFESARAAETAIEQTVNATKGQVASVNRSEFQLQALEREVSSNKQLYEMFMGRLKETNAADGLQTTIGRILESAGAGVKVWPHTGRTVVGTFAVAFLLAMVITVVLHRTDSTLKSSEDVERRLQIPMLGSLPMVEASDGDASTLYLRNPRGLFGEAVRTVRTSVLLSCIESRHKVIVVTSSIPEEGKSTVSAALAQAHAQTKSTLLIDSDMRRPSLGVRLGFDRKVVGLSDLLSGVISIEQAIRSIEGTDLKFIAAGSTPPNPLELILSPRYRELIDQLSAQFEIIVIDTPPVKLVSDAVVISGCATGVIYVSKADATPYRMAQRGIRDVQRAGGRIIGMALNKLDFEKADRYYGEYSGYAAYGYRRYYGDTRATEPQRPADLRTARSVA